MGVHGTCSICTELYDFSGADGSFISVVPCGHTFHHHCLAPWLNTKLNCPECRKSFKRNAVIERLYFNVEEVDIAQADEATLRNEIDSLKCQLRAKDSEKAELHRDNASMQKKLNDLKDQLKSAQSSTKEERVANQALTRELKYHKTLQKDAEEAKKETYRIQKKLVDLKKLEEVVAGNQYEINEHLQSADKEQLATFSVIMRKELDMKKQELKTLRQEVQELRKVSSVRKKQLLDATAEAKQSKEKASQLEQDLLEVESRNDRLKEKINKLEQALGSPSDAAVSFASRLIHESPAPLAKRPKLTSPQNDTASPEFKSKKRKSDEFLSPESDVKLPVTHLSFVNASNNSSKANMFTKPKSGLQDKSNIANVSGLNNFNLFKKSSGSGLLEKGGCIRTGYNGFGGHEKFVESSRTERPFGKPAQKKAKSVFGKSKTSSMSSSKAPSLPTLDNFLS